MQEIVYLIQTGLDFEGAQKQVLETRFPYLEHPYVGLASIKKTEGPRFIKTHLPISLLPKSVMENGTKVAIKWILQKSIGISLTDTCRSFTLQETPKMSRLVTIISYEWQPLLAIAVEWRASSLNSLKAMVILYT